MHKNELFLLKFAKTTQRWGPKTPLPPGSGGFAPSLQRLVASSPDPRHTPTPPLKTPGYGTE